MKQDELDLRQALDYIDPRELSYSEWVGVGTERSRLSRRSVGGLVKTGRRALPHRRVRPQVGQLSRHGHAHHGGNHRADGAARRLAAERRRL